MPPYIIEKVMKALEELIGPDTLENRARLKSAIIIARLGVSPANRQFLSSDTLTHLKALESKAEFPAHKDAFIDYVLSTQRDA